MAEDGGLKLLDLWSSPFGQRCRIALEEKSLEYEYVEQDLLSGKSELLLKSNPIHKKIPVLLHEGKPVLESLIIVQYIDEVWPGPNPILPPSDPYARAQALFWADYVDKKVFNCINKIWTVKGEVPASEKQEFIQILKTLEDELGDKKYFGGDAFGIVDIALVPFSSYFFSYEAHTGLRVEQECAKLTEWVRRCKERESVAKTLHDPKKIHEFVGLLRKKHGTE